MHPVLMQRQTVTPAWVEAVVDVVVRGLAGACAVPGSGA